MAAFDVLEPRSIPKRKRSIEQSVTDDERCMKKLTSNHVGASTAFHCGYSTFVPIYSQPLTPDDSSDDEAIQGEKEARYRRRARATDLNRLSTCSMSSVHVNVDEYDEDMDIITSPTTSLRIQRPIKYINSPPRMTNLLSAPSLSMDERLPTPTASRFDSLNATFYRRSWHDQRHTALSPLMYEETGLPSPTEPLDFESQMAMDSASDELSGLRMYCSEDTIDMEMEDRCESHEVCHDDSTTSPRQNGKTARFHMGFLADCDKCIRRVPGHYSHIMWS